MPRIRTIKPEAFTSDSLSLCSVLARWTFAGLWTYCDDEGRARNDVRLIKAALFPIDDRTSVHDVANAVAELMEAGCICAYKVDDKPYFHVPNWLEHQKVPHPSPSKLPPCNRADCPANRAILQGSAQGSHDNGMTPTDNSPQINGKPVLTRSHEKSSSSHDNGSNPHDVVSPERKGKERKGSREPADAGRADVGEACFLLADLIEANGSRRPTISDAWKDEARRMFDIDHRPWSEAERVMRWAQASTFWRPNIMSMRTFRAKYDTLRLQAFRDEPVTARPKGMPETW